MNNHTDNSDIIKNPPNLQTAQDVEEYILILSDHQYNCEKASKYMEAESSRNRISELKTQLSSQRKKDIIQAHQMERQDVEKAHIEEFNQFNQFWDQKMLGFDEESKRVEGDLVMRQEQEFKQAQDELDKGIPFKPRESSEVLNLKKIEEHMAKQKNYVEAHKIQQRRQIVERDESHLYLVQRNQKIKNQLGQLAQRHSNELNALLQRISAGQDELRKNRSMDLERLLQKYQNVKNELDAQQQMELLAYEGQFRTKGGNSNSIQMKSSSKIK